MLSLAVHPQDGGALGLVGERNFDLAVESTRPKQGRIEHLGPVGGSHHHHSGGGVEAVHLGQELVEGLLTFVVRDNRAASALTDGVNLVDEDDRRCSLARVGEEVAHPRCPHPDKQFDEAGPRESQKWNPGFPGYRSCHEGLARAWRTHHEHSPRSDGTGMGVPLGVTQEVHHLGHLPLGPLVASDVGEPSRGPFFVVDLGPRTSEAP